MIDLGRVLGLIPARGGSKGLPGKNIKPLAGRPLIAYTLDAGRESGVVDRLLLSTDSEEIAEVGRRIGLEVPFLRPPEFAEDETPMTAVIEHALDWLDEHESWRPEVIVLLQPTAPLRRPEHVVAAVRILAETDCDAVASVIPVPRHLSPDYVMRIEEGRLVNFLPEGERVTRRQDARRAYSRDGSVYAFRRRAFEETGSIYGDDCRPLVIEAAESVAIDTPEDWQRAERLLAARGQQA